VNALERVLFALAWARGAYAAELPHGVRGLYTMTGHGPRVAVRPMVLAAWHRCRQSFGIVTPARVRSRRSK